MAFSPVGTTEHQASPRDALTVHFFIQAVNDLPKLSCSDGALPDLIFKDHKLVAIDIISPNYF